LDTPNTNGVTLHHFILSLPTADGTDEHLFLSVDHHWRDDYFVFQFLPQHKDEAFSAISSILPLLQYHFPDDQDWIATWFVKKTQ
jgi:hypothetical protein